MQTIVDVWEWWCLSVDRRSPLGSSTTRHVWARVDITRLWSISRQWLFTLTAAWLKTTHDGSSITNLSLPPRSSCDRSLRSRTRGCSKLHRIITRRKNWMMARVTRCQNGQARQGKILAPNSADLTWWHHVMSCLVMSSVLMTAGVTDWRPVSHITGDIGDCWQLLRVCDRWDV